MSKPKDTEEVRKPNKDGASGYGVAEYRNAVDLAFWDTQEDVGNFGGAQNNPYKRGDPSRKMIVSPGPTYEDALRSIFAELRRSAGGVYSAGSMADMLEQAMQQDLHYGSPTGVVYVGIITGVIH